jgi:hypothetical protein
MPWDGTLARDEMEERYGYASAIDATRLAVWSGESVDFARPDGGAYPYFTFAAAAAAAMIDGEIFRAVVRRNTFLDPLSIVDGDPRMRERIQRVCGRITAVARPRPGPSRDELIEVMSAATA